MPISLPPSPTASLIHGPARKRSSSGAVQGDTSTPRMLRGRPSALRPQRSMATAWLTPVLRQSPISRSRPSSTPTSSTVTPPPAALDGRAHGGGAGRVDRNACRHAAGRQRGRKQRRADRAVGFGGGDLAARHEEAGDQADARGFCRASSPRRRARRHLPRSAPPSCGRRRGRPALRWRRCDRHHFSLATYTPVQSGGESSIRPSTRARMIS